MKQIKLLYVCNDIDFFISHRLPLAKDAAAAGYEVVVAAPQKASMEKVRQCSIRTVPILLSRRGMNPLNELAANRSIYHLYRSEKPTIAHLITIKPVIYGNLARLFSRVPITISAITGLGHVFIAKGLKASLTRIIIKALYRIAFCHSRSFAIFQNQDDRQQFLKNHILPETRTTLIRGSGVDIEDYRPCPEPSGPITVVLAARMLWTKGIGLFVDAAKWFWTQNTLNTRFVLVGMPDEGNPTSLDVKQLKQWSNQGTVEWWGHRTDMPEIFASSHIVCLPSAYGEGVPKVLIEAAACERPLISTDMPGCRDIVQNGVNGFCIEVGNLQELIDKIQLLASNAELRHRMGTAGRKLVTEHFTLDRVNHSTLKLYDDTMNQCHSTMEPAKTEIK